MSSNINLTGDRDPSIHRHGIRDHPQVTKLGTSFDIQFELIPSAVDGEDAYKKMEQVV